MIRARVRGVVLAGTGVIGFPKRRSCGILNSMRSTWYTAVLRITAVSPKPRQAYDYTVYHVEKRVPDYESNTTVRDYTLTRVYQNWTRRVVD